MDPVQRSRTKQADLKQSMSWLADEDLRRFLQQYGLKGLEHAMTQLIVKGMPTVAEKFTTDDISQEDDSTITSMMRLAEEHIPPLGVDSFVGRAGDLDRLVDELKQPGNIIVISGMGGIGKTALAVVALETVRRMGVFKDGIVWISCAGRDDPVDILREVLSRFDSRKRLPESTDLRVLVDVTQRLLKGKSSLVVLDNVEADAAIERVIDPIRNSGVTVLLTARHFVVLSNAVMHRLALMPDDEALTLFAQQLGRSLSALSDADQEAARRIVSALGRHTLAVKMAGAYAATTSRALETLASELEADPLATPASPAGAVGVIFRQSIEQLPKETLRLFTSLAAFATREFGRGAALALARGIGIHRPERELNILLSRVLLEIHHDPAIPQGADRDRLQLHQLLRELSVDRFRTWGEGERNRALEAVAQFYAGFCAQLSPSMLDAVDIDLANITAALRWAQEHHRDELIVDMCTGLGRFWNQRGQTHECLEALPRAREAAQRLQAQRHASEYDLRIGTIDLAYAQALQRNGKLDMARDVLDSDLRVRRQMGDRAGEARVRAQLGQLARAGGQMEDAESHLKASREIYDSLQDRNGKAVVLAQLGHIAKTRGRLIDANSLFSESLGLCREMGDRVGEADVLESLGQIARLQGETKQAQIYFDESLKIAREKQYPEAEANALSQLGQLARARGRLGEADTLLQQSLAIRRRTLDMRGEGFDLGLLGRIAQARGKLDEAEKYFKQSLRIAESISDLRGQAAVLSSLAQIALARGKLDVTEEHLSRSLPLRQEVQDVQGESIDLSQFGRLFLDRGEYTKAAEYFRKCLKIEEEMNDLPGQGVDLSQLGLAYLESGDRVQAAAFLNRSLDIRRRVQDVRGEGVDLALLGRIAFEESRLDEAEHYYEQSQRLARQVQNRRGEGVNTRYLGLIAEKRDELVRGERLLRESLAIAREVDNGLDIADALRELARFTVQHLDNKEQGCVLMREALQCYQTIGAQAAERQARQVAAALDCRD